MPDQDRFEPDSKEPNNENAKTSHYSDSFNYFDSRQLDRFIDEAVNKAVDTAFARHSETNKSDKQTEQDAIDAARDAKYDKALDAFIDEFIESYNNKRTWLQYIDRRVLEFSRLAVLTVVGSLLFTMWRAKYATNPPDLQYYTVTGSLITGVFFGIVPYWFYLERRAKFAQRKLVVGVVKT